MYDPYQDRRERRAQRRLERAERRYYRYQNSMRGLAGGLFLLALIAAFAFSNIWGSIGFLPLLFVGLAFLSLFGTISTTNRNGIYGGLHGFVWMLGLALCFAIGFWPWILLPVAVTMILGSLFKPIMSGLNNASFIATTQQQPYPQQEQPTPQAYQEGQPGYQTYQQGYQGTPAQPHEAYQEHTAQYEQPQVEYPEQHQQELPPMEQQ